MQTLEGGLGICLSHVSTSLTQLRSPNRCVRLTPEGLQEGMKWRESGAQGLGLGEGLDRRLGGAGVLPCGWLTFLHQAGLVERMTSPAWKSPWRVLGSGVGEGSRGLDSEELGG